MKNYFYPQLFLKSNYTISEKIKYFIKAYFILIFSSMLAIILISFIDKFVTNILNFPSILIELKNSNTRIANAYGKNSFLLLVIIIPFLEELIFRLPLDLKKRWVAISISITYLRLSIGKFGNIIINSTSSIANITIAFILLFIIDKYTSSSFFEKFKNKYYNYFFYTIAFIFGALHIGNLQNLYISIIYIYPIYFLPQILSGIIIGNVRLKNGFFWGIALHSLINMHLVSYIFKK